uniref:Serine aminopeptidase S33 domain-containing protein n=1 Tax=Leptocylindrus danicus TaxID=163516 RepID=A0A7S2P3W0_9STRA
MTMRFLLRSLKDSWKITAGLAMKKVIRDDILCRELFFDSGPGDDAASRYNGVTDEDIKRYQANFERDSMAMIDLGDLAGKLPSKSTVNGIAEFIIDKDFDKPCLVVGAADDFIVDNEGVIESARYFAVQDEVVTVDSAHDVMLGGKWKNCAKELETWLQTNFA